MALNAATVYRDYETDGVPASGRHKPKKPDIRQWGAGLETIINAFLSNGGLIYASLSALNADLAHGANTMAWVLGDATVANNGIYRKTGASGTGSWTRVADLPFSFIIASDVGAGTANAIQATTSIPVSGSALIWMNVFEANTASPVTVRFNAGSALTIKTNSGNNVTAGGLIAGMIVLGVVSGSAFRLVSDQASAAIVAATEGFANAAAASADAAEASYDAISDLTSSRLAIKLKTTTTNSVVDYTLTNAVPAENGHQLIDVYLGGVLQPKDGIVYTVTGGGTTLHLSSNPGASVDLYVEGAAAYANPLPVDEAAIADIAAVAAVEIVRELQPHPYFMSWVTDPSAADWAPYFNQCLSDVNALSSGRGGRILLPCRDIPVSKVAPFTYNGIALEGAYRTYWEGEALGTRIIPLPGADDLFTIGNMSTDTEGFTVEKVRIDCGYRTGGLIYKASRVRMFNIVNSSHRDPVNFAEIRGGTDICFEKVHCEAYRGLGLNVIGDVARVDRLRLNDFKCSGSGTESTITNTGPALAVSGYVETIDTNLVQLVKVYQGIRMVAAGGHRPRFVTMQNTQIDYCKNELMDIEDVYDFKSSQLYNNTSLDSAGLYFGAGARRVTLTQSGLSGAKHSAIGFAGKALALHDFSFQDWNTGGTGAPCIDLVSGFDRAEILACTVGKWGDELGSGGGAGTRAVRVNAGTGRVLMDQTDLASDLDFSGAAPGTSAIQNNGSGTITLGTNPTN